MVLETSAGKFALHFRHIRGEDNETRYTEASIHPAPCLHNARPCGTLAAIGIATCSKYDSFDKAVGRRISLTRALTAANLDRNLRRELWTAFWRQRPAIGK